VRDLELSRPGSALSVEPIDTIVELARAVGAHAIASAAWSLAERLHRARTFIALVGTDGPMQSLLVNAIIGEGVLPLNVQAVDSIPIVVRYGKGRRARIVLRSNARRDVPLTHLDRFISTAGNFGNHRGVLAVEITAPARVLREGVCLVVGLPGDAPPPTDLVPRIDAAIVASMSAPGFDDDSSRLVGALRLPSSEVVAVAIPHVDDELVAVVRRLAARTGAVNVEGLHDQEIRRLCLRLELHLLEQRDALDRPEGDLARQHDAIEACLILAEHLESDRATHPDEDRLALERSLAIERTKFLMRVKADALADFTSRFAASDVLRRDFHDVASTTATEIASNAIEAWRRSLGSIVDASTVAMGNRLIRRTHASFGPFIDWVPALALLSVESLPWQPAIRMKMPPVRRTSGVSRLRDRLRTAASARRCTEQRAVTALVGMLETSSHEVVGESLSRYDLAAREIGASLPRLLDQLAETARCASSRARDVRSGGPGSLLEERNRIERLVVRLAELMGQL
jgi:hypothetical protein